MSTKKSFKELIEEKDELEKRIKIERQNLKSLQYQERRYLMKQRTHRLCKIGGTVVHYMPLEQYSDDKIISFIETVFNSPDIVKQLNENKNP